MPLTTETTNDCQGIIHNASGTVTGEELVAASHAALQLVQNTQNFQYEFVDLTYATGMRDLGDAHLDQIVAQDRLAATYRPDAVIIIVAPRDDLYAVGEAWEERVRGLGWNTHISRDRNEALDWLGENYPPPPRAVLEAEIDSANPVEAAS